MEGDPLSLSNERSGRDAMSGCHCYRQLFFPRSSLRHFQTSKGFLDPECVTYQREKDGFNDKQVLNLGTIEGQIEETVSLCWVLGITTKLGTDVCFNSNFLSGLQIISSRSKA